MAQRNVSIQWEFCTCLHCDSGGVGVQQATSEFSSGVGKHEGPIWQIQWVHEGSHREESLFTAAADGLICQWDYSKVGTYPPKRE